MRDRDWLLLSYWLFMPLAVFFLARSRLHLYILPLFVPSRLDDGAGAGELACGSRVDEWP